MTAKLGAMPLEPRAENVLIVRLTDDPGFTADLDAVSVRRIPAGARVALDFGQVRFINSSNLAKLLRVREWLVVNDGKLVMFGVDPQVMGVFKVTGLDKVFDIRGGEGAALAG
jgi:anti-anti-sigma factor